MQAWEEPTVRFLDSARIDYLQTTGSSPLKQYEIVQTRATAAAGRCETSRQWVTDVMRGLRIASPSRWLSSRIRELVDVVGGDHSDFLTWVRDEIGYLMALCQEVVEDRRERRRERDDAKSGSAPRSAGAPNYTSDESEGVF